MKAAVSIVLAGLIVMIPLQQVQAQAEQLEGQAEYRAASPDSAAHRLRVPPPTENTARLLGASSERAMVPVTSPADLTPVPMSKAAKIGLIVVGGLVVLAAAGLVALANSDWN